MAEKVLLDAEYKYFKEEYPRNCDKFYQKKIDDKRHFNVYYYDKFKDNGALDYDYEFELYIEHENYVETRYIYGITYPYTIEEIEKILLGERK